MKYLNFSQQPTISTNSPRNLVMSWLSSFLFLFLVSASGLTAQTVSPTFPPLTNFLWSNTSVNAVGQTSFVGGTGLPFRYMLPKNFNPNVKYPAILFLHGTGECGTDNNAQLAASGNTAHGAMALVTTANPDNQDNYPCFFIAPQIPVGSNWSNDAVASEIQNLITIFETQYPNSFDTTRLYLTGDSLGGFGTYDLPYLLAQSDHLGANPFAAIAPMSGQLGLFDGRPASTEPNIPVWAFHGVLDTNVPIAQSDDVDVPALRALGRSVIYTRYANASHDIWELAYQHPLLLPWLFSQTLGQATQAPLSNFAITSSSQSGGSYLNLNGTAGTDLGYNGISWVNTLSGLTGNGPSTMTPTWSLANIPLLAGPNLIQVNGQAPTNTALVYGVSTNYGGTTTVNLPYTASPVSGPTNVALGKTVTVSSTDSPSDAGSNAVDGNLTTRWSSAFSDPQWIEIDLGANYAISQIDLNWEAACGMDYLIQTSTDNVNWTTKNTVTGNTTSGVLAYAYNIGSYPVARYVKMYGTARATGWGYSLWEFSVYSPTATPAPTPAPPPAPTPTPAPTAPSGSLVSLNKPVTVSSTDSPADAGSNAVDGNLTTRWSSAYSDPQWIEVDLGADYAISEVDLNWQTACGMNYLIQTSTDNVNWTTQTTVTGNTTTGLLQYPYSAPPTARYVRMYGTARATGWGYSLYELSVYSGSSPTDSTPSLFFQNGTSLGMYSLDPNYLLNAWQGIETMTNGWQEQAIGDINGDGIPDVIFQNGTLIGALTMNADGTPHSWISIGSMNAGWQLRGAAEITGDGNLDLIFQNGTLIGYVEVNSYGQPVSWKGIAAMSAGWQLHAVASIDGTGQPDLIFQNGTALGALQVNSSGVPTEWTGIGGVGAGWTLSDAVDVTGDGQPDLIFQSGTLIGALTVNTSLQPVGWHGIGSVGSGWTLPGDY